MILHLFKKDVRHTRLLLVVWLLLVAFQCVLVGWSVHPGDQVLQKIYYAISIIVPLFQSLLLVVIVPILMQEEPLVGTTAFWLTRPISRSSVLGAKALYAAMLIALPLLAEIGVLAANGVTPHDIGLAVPEIILGQLSVIIVIGAVAALTPSFGRFAIAGAIVIVSWMVLSMVIFWMHLLHNPESIWGQAGYASLIKARGVAESLLFVAGGGAIIIHQYLTRKTARSIAGAAIVVLGAIAIMGFWPWNFLAAPPLVSSGVKIDASAVTITLGRSMSRDLPSVRGVGTPKKSFAADIDARGLPAGFVISAKSVHPRLSLADGHAIAIEEPTPLPFNFQPYFEALEHALDGTPVVNRDTPMGQGHLADLLTINADVYNKYADQPLNLAADVDFVASRYMIISAMPLVRGARYDHGSEHAVITDVLRQGDSVEILMQQRRVKLLFDRTDGGSSSAMFTANFNRGDDIYVLRNKKLNQAVLAKQDFVVDFGNLAAETGRRLVQRTLSFSFGPEQNRLTPDLTEAWLADAQLVRLQLVPMAEFSKPIAAQNLRLNRPYNYTATESIVGDEPDVLHMLKGTLPANASKAQVKEYVDDILAASQRRISYQQDDPQVGMLAKVGPKNLDVLFEAEDGKSRNLQRYVDWAIEDLAQPEDKKAILQALPAHINLIVVVAKYGWIADAHDTLMAVLKDEEQRDLPGPWIRAIASFEDPSSYPYLKAYFVRCFNKQQTFYLIRNLPGIDLADTVDAGWKEAKYGPPGEVLSAIAPAAEFGHLDAIEEAVNILRQDAGNPAQEKRAAGLIRRFTSATGDSDALIAWFDANRGHLAFDVKKRKFLPQTIPTPDSEHH